jgi:Uma2 family endonuclease
MAMPRSSEDAVFYPESDDQPMSDSQLGGAEMVRITQTLQAAFADRPDVYVWMNMFVYYERGNPAAVFSPDVFVVTGVPKEPMRRTWKVWEEGKQPTVIFEVASSSTYRDDALRKMLLYARLGVEEYVLYDPHAEFLREPLQGYRLDGRTYVPLATDAAGALLSDALGMRLMLVDGRLRFVDRQTGRELLSPDEQLDAEQAAREAAEARAAAAEARAAELEARLREREREARP